MKEREPNSHIDWVMSMRLRMPCVGRLDSLPWQTLRPFTESEVALIPGLLLGDYSVILKGIGFDE